MSQRPNIDRLKDHAERLLSLLNDPHPGLFTWNGMYHEQMIAIAEFIPDDVLLKIVRDRQAPFVSETPP